jgi:hypothetical protein
MMGAPIFASPSALLDDLGITEPEELDIKVIAQHCNATVVFRPLEGCAARITGTEDEAIITLDSNSRPERQRFSAGHELGHWMFDRGKMSLFTCEEQVFVREWSKNNPESRANKYASDLLLPLSMFKPRIQGLKRIDFQAVKDLAKVFQMSLTATAIRLVEHGPLPAMLVCSSPAGTEWFFRGPGTKSLWPKKANVNTYAHDVLTGAEPEAAGDVSATAWFDHPLAERYEIHEHAIRVFNGLVLSLLWFRYEALLIKIDDYEEREAARRSDSRWR